MAQREKPGFMTYHDDVRPFADYLTDEMYGKLMKAVLNYSQYGEWVDDDCDPQVLIALRIIKPKIDRDAAIYEKRKLHADYMTYARTTTNNGGTPMKEDQWIVLTQRINEESDAKSES